MSNKSKFDFTAVSVALGAVTGSIAAYYFLAHHDASVTFRSIVDQVFAVGLVWFFGRKHVE